MVITTKNQKPVELDYHISFPVANTYNPYELQKQYVIEPLFTPITAGQPAYIADDGKNMSEDDVADVFGACMDENISPTDEERMKAIFNQTLMYYEKALSAQCVYAVQEGKKKSLLLPNQMVKYVPQDVKDEARKLLGDTGTRGEFFAVLTYYAKTDALAYYFSNEAEFDNFKTYFDAETQQISSLLPPETIRLCSDFKNIKLDQLTNSLILRSNSTENNDPYSFARILPYFLTEYVKQSIANNEPDYKTGMMPLSASELFSPHYLVFVNVERHAKASSTAIDNEWNIINSAICSKPKILNPKQIARLTTAQKMAQRMQMTGFSRNDQTLQKAKKCRFRKTEPTAIDLYKALKKIYDHARNVQASENTYISQKFTFMKPSRRDPMNPDRQGITKSVKYKPDLHLYVDNSGSISERQYQDAVKACIKLAKKMNINFYYNAFSNFMSTSIKLNLKGKNEVQIYKEFQKRAPKIDGGTDFEQVWHYINNDKKRTKEISLMITDFGFTPRNGYIKHPKYLFYAPISGTYWSSMMTWMENFVKSMSIKIAPDIRKRILVGTD